MRGYIRKRSNGSWEVTLDTGIDPLSGKRMRHFETVRGAKKDAERRLNELLVNVDRGIYVKPNRMKVGQFLEEWLKDYVELNTAPRTKERYEDIVHLHLIPAFGSIPLPELRPHHIQKYYTRAVGSRRLDGKGILSQNTVNKHHRVLYQALKYGMKHGILASNPAEFVDPPAFQYKEPTVPTENDIELILNEALGTDYYSLFYLMAYSGLRRGEALALRWCDVDLDKGILGVKQTLQQLRNREFIFKKPKSKKSRRQIELTPSSVILLWDHRIRQEYDRKILGKPLSPTDLVFSQPDGKPLRPDSITRAFKDIVRSLTLDSISLHSLRHAHATILLKQGIHPKIVQERLGHSSISTTLDVYSHVLPGLQEAAAKRFDEGLPQTTLKDEYDILAKRLEIRVGKMSAILPIEPILS